MSDFDDAFALGDEDAFSTMGETIAVWQSGGTLQNLRAVVSPAEASSANRDVARAELGSLEVELEAEDVNMLGIEEGWRIRWNGRDYRINNLVFQGSTVTALCGRVGDAQ